MQRGLTPSSFAVAAVFMVLALSLPLLLLPSANPQLSAMFSPELVELHQMLDSTSQRAAHRVALLLIAALSLGGMALVRDNRLHTLGERVPAAVLTLQRLSRFGGLVALLALAGLCVELPRASALAPASPALEPSNVRVVSLALSVLLVEALSRAVPWLGTPRARALLWLGLVGYCAALLVPGLALPLDLSGRPPEMLAAIESHYSSVLGSAGRLAAGALPFEAVPFHYGVLTPTLLAIVERAIGGLDFASEVRAVQASQLLFGVLAALAYATWRPRAPHCALAAMLLLVPFLSSFSLQAWFPNQTGSRFLAFPLGALALLYLRQREVGPRAGALLGGASTLFLLQNLETGIVVAFAFVFYLASRVQPLRAGQLAALAGGYLGGAAAVFAAFLCLFRAALGEWPLPDSPQALFSNMGHFLAGFAGRPMLFDPLTLLLFAHAAHTVVLSAVRWRAGRLGADGSFRAAMAAALLIWLAYYVNRPHPLNLWSLLFLYGFLLVDLLELRVLGLRSPLRAGISWVALPARTALLAFVVLPAIVQSNWQAFERAGEVLAAAPPAASGARRVSGVWLDAETASIVEQRAEYLRSRPGEQAPVYFSSNVYLLPQLTGVYSPLAMQDAFAETVTNADFDELVAQTLLLAPRQILFDGDTRLAGPAQQQRFFARLQQRLAHAYRPAARTQGWQILEPIDPAR